MSCCNCDATTSMNKPRPKDLINTSAAAPAATSEGPSHVLLSHWHACACLGLCAYSLCALNVSFYLAPHFTLRPSSAKHTCARYRRFNRARMARYVCVARAGKLTCTLFNYRAVDRLLAVWKAAECCWGPHSAQEASIVRTDTFISSTLFDGVTSAKRPPALAHVWQKDIRIFSTNETVLFSEPTQ